MKVIIFYIILLKICNLYKVKYIPAKKGICKIYTDKNQNLNNFCTCYKSINKYVKICMRICSLHIR